MTEHIQINAVAPRIAYVADGVQLAFTYPFAIFRPEDIEVWLDDVVLSSGFSVSGAGITGGGAVLFTVPPAAGQRVTLRRRLALARTADYQADGLIRAKTLNDEFDFQVAALQQVAEEVERTVRQSPTSASLADLTLPEPVAHRGLKWNAAGTALVNSDADPDATGNAALAAADAMAAAATATAARDQAVAAVGGVKVSVSDTVAAPLADKLVAGAGIVLTPSADDDQTLIVAATESVPAAIFDRLDFLERNLAVNTLRDQIDAGWSVLKMADGIADEFEDETGITSKAGATYDATSDYYHNPGVADANTKLLVCADSLDTATTFSDDSPNAFAISCVGSPVISTAQAKFGTASAYLGGVADSWFLTTPSNTAHDLGGDFTIDCWLYMTAYDEGGCGIARKFGGYGTTTGWQLSISAANILFYANASTTVGVSGNFSGLLNGWHHLAVSRSGNNFRFFVDGVQVGATQISSVSVTASSGALTIGSGATYSASIWYGGGDTAYLFSGYIDEFRISNLARWTADFAVPTQSHKAAPDMVLLSQPFAADAVPGEARLVLLHQAVVTLSLNIDCTIEVSRDGGTTWTAGTLVAEGAFDAATTILSALVDLSAQPAGSSMKWRFSSFNNKEQRLHGVWMQWR